MNLQHSEDYRPGCYCNVKNVGVSAYQGKLYFINSGNLCVSNELSGTNPTVLVDKIPDFSGNLRDSMVCCNKHGIFLGSDFVFYHYDFQGKLLKKTKFRTVLMSLCTDGEKVYLSLLNENSGAYTLSVYEPLNFSVEKLANTTKEVKNLCVYDNVLYFDKEGVFSGYSLYHNKNLNFAKLNSGNSSLEPMYLDVVNGSLWMELDGVLYEYSLPKDPKEEMEQKSGKFDLCGVFVSRRYGASYFDGKTLLYAKSYYEFASLDAQGKTLQKTSELSHGECESFRVLGQNLFIDLAAMKFQVRPLSNWPNSAIGAL